MGLLSMNQNKNKTIIRKESLLNLCKTTDPRFYLHMFFFHNLWLKSNVFFYDIMSEISMGFSEYI